MQDITVASVRVTLAKMGMVLSRKHGEFKVNWRNGREETAYYTDDLHDALETAVAMSRPRKSGTRH